MKRLLALTGTATALIVPALIWVYRNRELIADVIDLIPDILRDASHAAASHEHERDVSP